MTQEGLSLLCHFVCDIRKKKIGLNCLICVIDKRCWTKGY